MSRTNIIIVLIIVLLAGVGYKSYRSGQLFEYGLPGGYTMRVGDYSVDVEIAQTEEERTRGLSGRNSLGTVQGLLLVFPTNDYHGIWMKEMKFSIDIIWISDDLRVVHIEQDVSPQSFPKVFESPEQARYVLEMKAQSTSLLGIGVGNKVELPPVLRE